MGYKCPNCDGNIRTIGTFKGTKVKCRHCGHVCVTDSDNIPYCNECIED